MSRETGVQSQVEAIPKTQKICKRCKVRIKGSVAIQGKEYHTPLHLGVVVNEKGVFGSPSTTVINFNILLQGWLWHWVIPTKVDMPLNEREKLKQIRQYVNNIYTRIYIYIFIERERERVGIDSVYKN